MGSPAFFLFRPASEPLRVLNMLLERLELELRSTNIAEWRELSGKKSEFSLRNPLVNGLFIFESLSILRWLNGFFSESLPCDLMLALVELLDVDEDVSC